MIIPRIFTTLLPFSVLDDEMGIEFQDGTIVAALNGAKVTVDGEIDECRFEGKSGTKGVAVWVPSLERFVIVQMALADGTV